MSTIFFKDTRKKSVQSDVEKGLINCSFSFLSTPIICVRFRGVQGRCCALPCCALFGLFVSTINDLDLKNNYSRGRVE